MKTATAELLAQPRRPIKGWEGFYEITATGQVYSVRQDLFIAHAVDDRGRPYIEVQIGGIRYERNIALTVTEVWGDTHALPTVLVNPAPALDPAAVKLWDKLFGTYQPPKRWGKAKGWQIHQEYAGRRGLWQCTGTISKDDRQGSLGDPAMTPIGKDAERFPGMRRIPLSHLVDLERAAAESGAWVPAAGDASHVNPRDSSRDRGP